MASPLLAVLYGESLGESTMDRLKRIGRAAITGAASARDAYKGGASQGGASQQSAPVAPETIPITRQPWFIPAVAVAGLIAFGVMKSRKGRRGKR